MNRSNKLFQPKSIERPINYRRSSIIPDTGGKRICKNKAERAAAGGGDSCRRNASPLPWIFPRKRPVEVTGVTGYHQGRPWPSRGVCFRPSIDPSRKFRAFGDVDRSRTRAPVRKIRLRRVWSPATGIRISRGSRFRYYIIRFKETLWGGNCNVLLCDNCELALSCFFMYLCGVLRCVWIIYMELVTIRCFGFVFNFIGTEICTCFGRIAQWRGSKDWKSN